ncbi:MAG: formimidoylglutamase [Candidatus Kapaibacterium sp.]
MFTFRHYCVDLHHAPQQPKQDATDIRFADVIIHGNAAFTQVPHIALLGVPQHIGVERNGGRGGAGAAPEAIRAWLNRLTISNGTDSISPNIRIADYGNINTNGKTLEEIHEAQQEAVMQLLREGAFVLVFGGGHDIAYPNGAALGSLGKTVGIINFDAHLDVRPFNEHGRHSGSPFRQLIEDPAVHIPGGCFAEFGIQSFSAAAAHMQYVLENGHHITMMHHIHANGFTESLSNTWNAISQAENVYCSFDIDGVSSAYAPGASAPSADGFTPRNMFDAALFIGAQKQTKLVDIVEVNPFYDLDARTSKLAATIAAHCIWARAQALCM